MKLSRRTIQELKKYILGEDIGPNFESKTDTQIKDFFFDCLSEKEILDENVF